MTNTESMSLFGRALVDYYRGDKKASNQLIREDGVVSELPASIFFMDYDEFSSIDRIAITFCKGHVLDVGAGAGRHCLELQKNSIHVTAVEIAQSAVDVLKKRGVKEVICSDILEIKDNKFDTILMLGHGLGICGDLKGLNHILQHLHSLLDINGLLICDSLDVSITDDPEKLIYHKKLEKAGRYRGEIRFNIIYKGEKGPVVKWLHVDPDTLSEYATANRYMCEIVEKDTIGNYLAILRPVAGQ